MIRRPQRSTLDASSAESDVYKSQAGATRDFRLTGAVGGRAASAAEGAGAMPAMPTPHAHVLHKCPIVGAPLPAADNILTCRNLGR
jgi:hypothetical protein